MDCERARELFSEYLEGNINHSLGALVRGHIDECSRCKTEYNRFKQAWCGLGMLPEVPLPASFRHDVIMRMARLQHEQRRDREPAAPRLGGESLLRRVLAVRAVAIACTAAALAFILFGIPQVGGLVFKSGLGPSVQIEAPAPQDRPSITDASSLQAARKQEWRSRILHRNSVWVTVTPNRNDRGTTIYQVQMSINYDGLLPGEMTARIGAQVYLLPPDQFDPEKLDNAYQVWDGSIVQGPPINVPVVVDESDTRTGSVNLLVTWVFRQRRFGTLIFLPAQSSRGSYGRLDLATGGSALNVGSHSLYSVLQTIAQDHRVPIIANAYLVKQPPIVDLEQRSLDEALRDTLEGIDLDWLYADDAVYVDAVYTEWPDSTSPDQ